MLEKKGRFAIHVNFGISAQLQTIFLTNVVFRHPTQAETSVVYLELDPQETEVGEVVN